MIWTIGSLFWASTYSTLIVMPQWKFSDVCHGEPSSIFVFNMLDLSQILPTSNETWPPFFQFGADFYYFRDGFCGAMKSPTFTQCCMSSIDATLSAGILSSNPYVLGDNFFEEALPKSVNGKSYCNVLPNNTNDINGNYYEFSILSSNQCIDDYYRCTANNSLKIYSESDCKGDVELYPLTNTETVFENELIGGFTGKMIQYQKGMNEIIWITDNPGYAVVPNTTKLGDVLTHIWISIYFLTVCVMLVHSTRMVIKLKTRFWICMIVLQLIRIAAQISRTYYYYTAFEDYLSATISGEIMFVLAGIEHLFSIYLTTFQIFDFKINFIPKNGLLQVITYTLIFIIHVLLFGANYFLICNVYETPMPLCPDFSVLTAWGVYRTYWGVFVLIWDLVPVTVIVMVIAQPDLSHIHLSLLMFKRMFTLDKRFTHLYLVQCLLTIGYFVFSELSLNTVIFGGDRMTYCIRHFTILLLGLHKVLTVLLLERIPIIFKLVSNKNDMVVTKSTVSEQQKSIPGTKS
ncbi:hypothetical protein BC833DRAFT_602313 [Globomyces pollinis-pini]|nr:hypothetical protein BC833DRAFT_602313 [Globomyces pollinis-pini]